MLKQLDTFLVGKNPWNHLRNLRYIIILKIIAGTMKFLEENAAEYLYKTMLNKFFFLQRTQNTINSKIIKLMWRWKRYKSQTRWKCFQYVFLTKGLYPEYVKKEKQLQIQNKKSLCSPKWAKVLNRQFIKEHMKSIQTHNSSGK